MSDLRAAADRLDRIAGVIDQFGRTIAMRPAADLLRAVADHPCPCPPVNTAAHALAAAILQETT